VTAEGAGYPRRAGNRVRPLVDGVPAFRRIGDAVEAARRRVWATIAFVDRTAELPGGRGTLFDLLDRAGARGVDVRVVFWREPSLDPGRPGWEHFPGTDAERAWLAERGSRFRARWDHLPRGCRHQKSWVVDAGEPEEAAFVGGINVDRMSIAEPGHAGGGEQYHDVYVELAGPAVTDVARNFVERWNGASERRRTDGVWPPGARDDDLAAPARVAARRGDVDVQVTRTMPGGGERTVLAHYLAAIDGARRAIYLENQFFAAPDVFARLDAALARGVEVVAVVPGEPLPEVRAARADPRTAATWDALARLGRHDRFTLAGLVATDGPGVLRDVYVHAKIGIVDDAWLTIGSANLEPRGLGKDTELNASCFDAGTARALRAELLREHLGDGASDEEPGRALARFRAVAQRNRERLRRGEPLRGLAVALDPARYAAEASSPVSLAKLPA
jgi:phosphatidylserine/phosphatidylglycerophosphate/cardiolipin synthase-like enzyme